MIDPMKEVFLSMSGFSDASREMETLLKNMQFEELPEKELSEPVKGDEGDVPAYKKIKFFTLKSLGMAVESSMITFEDIDTQIVSEYKIYDLGSETQLLISRDDSAEQSDGLKVKMSEIPSEERDVLINNYGLEI